MKNLDAPDSHHLSAALGWSELGNYAEAKVELGKIQPDLQAHPNVLEVKLLVSTEAKDWQASLEVARLLVEASPDRSMGWLQQAYALRRVPSGGLSAAWQALLPAADRFPDEPIIPYNLSCYACQLGQLDVARTWLKRALKVGSRKRILRMALSDEDLGPLWEEIKTW